MHPTTESKESELPSVVRRINRTCFVLSQNVIKPLDTLFIEHHVVVHYRFPFHLRLDAPFVEHLVVVDVHSAFLFTCDTRRCENLNNGFQKEKQRQLLLLVAVKNQRFYHIRRGDRHFSQNHNLQV